MEDDSHRIRPAGRHLLTIGRDLIQDHYAAVIELVKNAYDADSPDVTISFSVPEKRDRLIITVEDSGHGMTRDTVINKWLVPSTDDKLKRKASPGGRTMQGRKGIGRYAAALLGADLSMETVAEGNETTVVVQWDLFEKAEYLDDVEILVETRPTAASNGTKLTMTAPSEVIELWQDGELDTLEYELKKLISPVEYHSENTQSFVIHLKCDNFWEGDDKEYNQDKEIEPFPIFDLYDYRISGSINSDGTGKLTFSNQKAKNTLDESMEFDLDQSTGCGILKLDIRVYDREPDAIDAIIKRGLTDPYGNYVGKLEARRLLDRSNGIGVYRNGFRIRPLGDADFDWLKLNEQRVQNPSMRIGSNQVIGYVQIQSEELSGLEEKSARDGLKDNGAYKRLRAITGEIISSLETKRFEYRKKAGLSRKTLKVEREFERLFSFEEIKESVRKTLNKGGVDKNTSNQVLALLDEKEKESNKLSEDIKQTVAIYQGQATLGKIVKVVLHEGRKPLGFFTNQIKNFGYWAGVLAEKNDREALDEMKTIMRGMSDNSQIFVSLFKRIDPLASGRRANRKDFDLLHEIRGSVSVFDHEIKESKVTVNIAADNELVTMFGWNQDIYIILTNLIDNSLFWMDHKDIQEKWIDIQIESEDGKLIHMDYRDSGPGIEESLINNGVIFDPEFSTKPEGTGLGLAIAGEAAARNGLMLKAFSSETGAYFRMQPEEGDEE
ncbi:MAG: ATP-binding protein [Zetaproteobacteria bacterium CG_4_9_14_3_um_filter_49_83]|nr:MAG: ATP-binding protein [Zetaproteobacteria bacterium CG1_02_49_23]PIQ34098.1 MAG: ATP-binding protein [Zetaproteobacteria bacterium CG17_big_fil_post_rev_8_21_14_2_50_50_13]PIV30225.1 MAG: ATP-binding protein [Zetaproteobacteria bacterium CG02_land_8_20_14_3_00_50_9]PIY55854.1 MAG: ATP-binding protein [Zetaproteobacteria bacterium CG_4_10_14_0_8_um_filter_49_80]PJA34984.1 MAG: ATP-binding protein [Zetaproteobacteria bacterium CG_4_9_14_3_um_filter_49_83]